MTADEVKQAVTLMIEEYRAVYSREPDRIVTDLDTWTKMKNMGLDYICSLRVGYSRRTKTRGVLYLFGVGQYFEDSGEIYGG